MDFSVTRVQEKLYLLTKRIGLPAYDFEFSNHFYCDHPGIWDGEIQAISRLGATNDYEARFNALLSFDIRLIHSPEEYKRTSFLPEWYPLIQELTPRSRWYDQFPEAADIEDHFEFPVFVKGERQTNRHSRAKSIMRNASELRQLAEIWDRDPILHWQRVVIRDYIPLQLIATDHGHTMPKAYEFRTFWWKGHCVSTGNYWTSEAYALSDDDQAEMLRVAGEAATLLNVAFLVIDMAKTQAGKWIVIEINDGQDAGYAGNNPFFLWNNILQLESED